MYEKRSAAGGAFRLGDTVDRFRSPIGLASEGFVGAAFLDAVPSVSGDVVFPAGGPVRPGAYRAVHPSQADDRDDTWVGI